MAFCKNCGKEIKKGEKCSCESEVKFCKSCGKELVGNETCDCGGAKSSTKDFDFVATMTEIKDDLLKVWKKPIDVINDNADANDTPKTLIGLALIALTFGLFIASIFKNIYGLILGSIGSLGALGMGASSAISKAIKLPYVKITLFALIIWAIMAAVYALVMLIIPAIFKNKKLNYPRSLTLTVTAFLPLIWANVICAVIGFLGLNLLVVMVPYLIVNIIVGYNFVYAYAKYTNVKDNKFAYVITVLLVLSSIITGICDSIVLPAMTESIGNDVAKSILDFDEDDFDLDDLEDLFNY